MIGGTSGRWMAIWPSMDSLSVGGSALLSPRVLEDEHVSIERCPRGSRYTPYSYCEVGSHRIPQEYVQSQRMRIEIQIWNNSFVIYEIGSYMLSHVYVRNRMIKCRPAGHMIRSHSSTSRACPGPLGRYGSAYQYSARRCTRQRSRHLCQRRRPSSCERKSSQNHISFPSTP